LFGTKIFKNKTRCCRFGIIFVLYIVALLQLDCCNLILQRNREVNQKGDNYMAEKAKAKKEVKKAPKKAAKPAPKKKAK
jgi:hypothetical protein